MCVCVCVCVCVWMDIKHWHMHDFAMRRTECWIYLDTSSFHCRIPLFLYFFSPPFCFFQLINKYCNGCRLRHQSNVEYVSRVFFCFFLCSPPPSPPQFPCSTPIAVSQPINNGVKGEKMVWKLRLPQGKWSDWKVAVLRQQKPTAG